MTTATRGIACGYTLVELLLVISIMSVLLAIAAPVVIKGVGRQAMLGSSTRVTAAHDAAMTLAMARYAPADNRHFGVALHQEAGQAASVTVIEALPAPFANAAYLNALGAPVSSHRLAADVEIWVGDQRLADLPGREIAWFYQYRTGCPIETDGPGRVPANVGLAAATTSNLFGLGAATVTCAGVTYACGAPASPAIAPPAGGQPGLSLRQGQLRTAIAIYASGVLHASEF